MSPSKDNRNRELAMIHIGALGPHEKGGLALDEDTYRAMLLSVAGVRSASDLDWRGRSAVIAHLKEKGAKFGPAKKARANRLASEPQAKMIRAMWIELHQRGVVRDPSEGALSRFVKRQTRVERLEWLNDTQANVVIESLKNYVKRVTP